MELYVTFPMVIAMTRYEQLVEAAIPCVHRHFEYFENCQRAAFGIAAGYAHFLEYPRDEVSFVILDQHLNRSEKSEPLGLEVPMVFGDDGFWYFCFVIKYQKKGSSAYLCEYIKLGLKLDGHIATIRGDADAEIDDTIPRALEAFFEQLFADSMQRCENGPSFPSKRVGFDR